MFSFPHVSRILFCDFCSDEDVGASRKPPSPLPGGRVQSRWGATVGQGPGGALGRHHLLSSGVVVTLTTPSLQPGDVAGQVGQLSLFAACRGHSGRAQRHFPEQGGGETPRNVVSICSTVNPAPPLGQPQGRGLAHRRPAASAGWAGPVVICPGRLCSCPEMQH